MKNQSARPYTIDAPAVATKHGRIEPSIPAQADEQPAARAEGVWASYASPALAWRGSMTVNVTPCSAVDSTRIVPPCAWTICSVM